MSKLKNHNKSSGKSRQVSGIQRGIGGIPIIDLIYCLVLFILTIFIYHRACDYFFVNWDDNVNVFQNDNIFALDKSHLIKIFTSEVIGNYNPFTILAFAIEYYFFGLDAFAFHSVNVGLHAINCLLVFVIFRQLKFDNLFSFVGAIIFAVHPMKVESVAWVTELKDLLYGFFFLLCVVLYLKYKCQPNLKQWFLISVLFIFSLLSKIQAVTLPITLLLLDLMVLDKVNWNLVLSKIHLFVLSLVTGVLGIYMLRTVGSFEKATTTYTIFDRLLIASSSFWCYLVKFFYSYENLAIYAFPKHPYLEGHHFHLFCLVLFLLLLFLLFFKKLSDQLKYGFLIFISNVVLMLQFFSAGQGFKADRFTYIAYIGLILALLSIIKIFRRNVLIVIVLVIYIGMNIKLTYAQLSVWENDITLWDHQIKLGKGNLVSFQNLGNYYRDSLKDNALALKNYEGALKIDSMHPGINNSKAKLLYDAGDFKNAFIYFRRSILGNPKSGEAYINISGCYYNFGKIDSAKIYLDRGIQLLNGTVYLERKKELYLNAYKNRFVVNLSLANYNGALEDFLTYKKFGGLDPNVYYECARIYRFKNRLNEALPLLEYAISTKYNKNTHKYYRELAEVYKGKKNMNAYLKYISESERLLNQNKESIY